MQDVPNQFADSHADEASPSDIAPSYDSDDATSASGQVRERRRHRRARVLWGGVLIVRDFPGEVACTVSDISAGGAKLLVPARPEGTDAEVLDNLDIGHRIVLSLRDSGEVPAKVVWQTPGRIGIRFEMEPDEVRERFTGVVPND